MELTIGNLNFFHAFESSPFYNLLIYTALVFVYALFVWKFYRFMAEKDILKLNLTKYNRVTLPTLRRIMATFLFFVEYVIILPFVVFFWYTVLATLLLLLSREQTMQQIFFISAIFISAVRISAYVNENLAREIAKILPLTALAVFALNPSFFMVPLIEKVKDAVVLLPNIKTYIIFIFGVEIFFRFLSLFPFGEDEQEEQVDVAITN